MRFYLVTGEGAEEEERSWWTCSQAEEEIAKFGVQFGGFKGLWSLGSKGLGLRVYYKVEASGPTIQFQLSGVVYD